MIAYAALNFYSQQELSELYQSNPAQINNQTLFHNLALSPSQPAHIYNITKKHFVAMNHE
jgi:7,8-dihydro-6-hydroxymethylpterin-pyrophosphokinase